MNVTHFVVYSAFVYLSALLGLGICQEIPGGFLIAHGLVSLVGTGAFYRDWRKMGIALSAYVCFALCLYKMTPDMASRMVLQEAMITAVLVYLIRVGEDPFAFLAIKKPRLTLLVLMLPETIFVVLVASFVNLCSGVFFKDHVGETLLSASKHFPAAILVICILPALSEEILFRGGILHACRERGKSVLLSASLFALWHMNPRQMTYAFVVGLLLAVMVVSTDNLVYCMLVHFLFNFYNLASVALPPDRGVGRFFAWLDRVQTTLIPVFLDTQGHFMYGNFARGIIVSTISVLLYLWTLYSFSPMLKKMMEDREIGKGL